MFGKLFGAWLLLTVANYGYTAERIFDWSSARINGTPEEFRAVVPGGGPPADWKIIADAAPSAFPTISPKATNRTVRPVLAQLSRDKTDARYPMLVYEAETFGDFTLTTEFKIVDGIAEQMAGIAFRIQDERNYFYIRASALGQNINFFKVQDGQLVGPIGAKAEIRPGTWYELTIQCRGNEIRCSLNGKEAIPALKDSTFGTGKIAFWTKSDSVSYFGHTRILYTPRENFAQTLCRDAIKKFPRLQKLSIIVSATNSSPPKIIASTDAAMVGQLAQPEALDVIGRGIIYHAEEKGTVHLTMPLRDGNGDSIAAVKLAMKAFPGQTEKNVLARAVPIIKHLEARVRNAGELAQ
jgi:hypothetical protein